MSTPASRTGGPGTLASKRRRRPRRAERAGPGSWRPVRWPGPSAEQRARHMLELDHDLGAPRRIGLAGAEVERHPGPAPIVDQQLDGDIGLRRAVGRHVGLVPVGLDRPPGDGAGLVLPAHRRHAPAPASGGGRPRSPWPSRCGRHRRRTSSAPPSPSSPAAGTCGSAPCRAARRSARRSCPGPPRRRSRRP